MKIIVNKGRKAIKSATAPTTSKLGTYTYAIDIGFSVDVNVSTDGVDEVYGTWKFDPIPNDRYGDAYIDEDTGAKIISVDDIAQYIIDALNANDEVTALSGTVTVNGVAFFSVDVDSVRVTDDFRGLDEDGDPYYDTEYDAEYSDAIVKEYNISVLNTVPVA